MRSLRRHPDPQDPAGSDPAGVDPIGFDPAAHGRLNLLLSYAGWHDDPWVDRLPRLLEPMGIRSFRARSAREAGQVIRAYPVHIAVVDLGLPLDDTPSPGVPEAGPKLLDMLARLANPPPTVVVKRAKTARDDRREIAAALRHGAFAVVDRPHDSAGLESMLDTLRRCLTRFYQGRWPGVQ